jgi:glycosyltransferase involved in cell wall biosynthesis
MIAGTSSGASKTSAPDGDSGKVSIVMPAYNTGPFIAEAVESVLAQSYPNWELVVVDDGSTDNTGSIVEGFADPRIIALRQPNGGLTSARNFGLSKVSGDWILFLDSDDLLRPNALDVLIEAAYAGRARAPAVVYGDYARIDETGARFGRRDLLTKIRKRPSGDLVRFLLQGFVMLIGTAIVRRDVAMKVGQLQAGLEPMEDWAWFALASLHGEFVSVGRTTMQYRLRKSSLSMTAGLNIQRYRPALDVVFENPELRRRFSEHEIRALRARREASICNFIAAQYVRVRNYRAAARAYVTGMRRSIRTAPRGAGMIALAAFGL